MKLPNLIFCQCLSYLSHSDLFHLATASKIYHPFIIRTSLLFLSNLSFEFIQLLRSLSCPISEPQWKQLALKRSCLKRKRNNLGRLTWFCAATSYGSSPCRGCGRSTQMFLRDIRLCQRCQSNPRRKYSFHVCKSQAISHFGRKIVEKANYVDYHPLLGYRYSWHDLNHVANF